MKRRKPDIPLILVAVFLVLLTAFVYVGTYFSVFGFLAQRIQHLPAVLMALLMAFIFTSTCIVLMLERRDPGRTLLWLLILLAFPVVGFIIYMVFGQGLIRRQRVIRRLRGIQGQTDLPGMSLLPNEDHPLAPSAKSGSFPVDAVQMQMSRLVYNSSGALLTWPNWVDVLNDGAAIFPAMLAAISGAGHHIHMQSYIFRDDDIGKAFFAKLAEKAAVGVQVRIIVDGVGSLGLSRARMEELGALGIEIKVHFPIRFSLFRNRLNYRNHRKILVVDGRVGFVGGANVGNDYLGLYPDIGNWRDTQIMIHGPAAAELQRLFFQDWITVSGELPGDNPGRFFPGFATDNEWTSDTALPALPYSAETIRRVISDVGARYTEAAAPGAGGVASAAAIAGAAGVAPGAVGVASAAAIVGAGGATSAAAIAGAAGSAARPGEIATPSLAPVYDKAVQIASSGPDSHYASIMHAYLFAISQAKETINITSPYFIPNQSILNALKTASLAGVEINLLVPRNPDKQMVYMAAMTYIEELMDDGVKVWLYGKGFLHSKIVTVDDAIAVVGTANMDERSFTLNFEVSALIYDKDTVEELNAAFHKDLDDSALLDIAEFRKRPLLRRILEAGCRLLSPLL
ncbi:MAG: phospholipase D-like domain-containing protein [Clostridiales bacterium]|nr:phospholipase D-like domain-containing protein [Clostridiales bacterium]